MRYIVHSYHNRFTALFPGPPRWAGARRELLDFMVQGKINRGRLTDHPAGRHSIRTNQCPPPPSPTLCIHTIITKLFPWTLLWKQLLMLIYYYVSSSLSFYLLTCTIVFYCIGQGFTSADKLNLVAETFVWCIQCLFWCWYTYTVS